MKFILLGTSEFSLRCAEAVLDSGEEICALISMPAYALPLNSADVSRFARAHGIPFHEIEDVNVPKSVTLIRGYAAEYLLASWPKLLGKEVLESPRFYCIGTHPTELPFNRGRHPLHWLIALGIQWTKLSFFRMDEGVDTGRVLLRVPFEIRGDDAIGDVVTKMNQAAYEGTKTLCAHLREDPSYAGEEQNHSEANTWRKRTSHDVTLDLRMSASMIVRTVRSFALPYPCANLLFESDLIKISDAALVETDMTAKCLQRLEPGKIICIHGKTITVKADDGLVALAAKDALPKSILSAKYIHPPSRYLLRWPEAFAAYLA